MKFRSLYTCLFALILVQVGRGQVLKITVDDTIQPITDEFIGRALDAAQRQHDDAVLIELRTPGGLLDSTRSIIQHMLASPVPVIVYVAPSGGYAASAGFFILEAADVAAMAPGTNTGSAHPVVFGAKMDDVMKAKMENDAAAFMRSFVSRRGRNVEVAESVVRQSKNFSEQEALNQKLIDLIASNDHDLLRQLDGKIITRFDGSKMTLHLTGKPVHVLDMTLKQRILSKLMDPNLVFIIFAIGMLAIYAEFNHPGAVLPGVVGLLCVLLALFALNILPTRYAALALIVAAFILFGLEAKFSTHGVLGLGGVAAMVLGALLLVDGPIPEMRVKLITALAVSVPFGLITVFLTSLVVRARRQKVTTGEQGLIGEIGVAQSALAPQGKVFVHGEIWDARARAPVNSGDRVVVRAVDGLVLEVEPVGAAADTKLASPAL